MCPQGPKRPFKARVSTVAGKRRSRGATRLVADFGAQHSDDRVDIRLTGRRRHEASVCSRGNGNIEQMRGALRNLTAAAASE